MDPDGTSPVRRSISPCRERRGRHPFADRTRENFPNLDSFLTPPSPPPEDEEDTMTTRISSVSAKKPPRRRVSPPDLAFDQSMFSQASSLDMSIGARAALTDHLRHIARCGIDGTPTKAESSGERNPRDDEWDRLVSVNNSYTSFSGVPNGSIAGGPVPFFWVNDDGMEAVEVLALEDRSDYFDTSRVLQLMTPEKKRAQAIRAISTRDDTNPLSLAQSAAEGVPSATVASDDGSTHSQEVALMHLFHAAMDIHDAQHCQSSEANADCSFLSVPAMDMSRLTTEWDGEARRSPEESFHRSLPMGEEHPREIRQSFHVTPSRTQRDASFSSPLSTIGLRRSPSPPTGTQPSGKENGAPNFADIALSPIAAKAGSIAQKLKPGARSDHPAFTFPVFDQAHRIDTPSSNFIDTMDSLRNDAPSPISQTNLSGFGFRDISGSNFGAVMELEESNDKSDSSRSMRPNSCPGDSGRVKTVYDPSTVHSFPLDVKDCRRYRTVVPRRIVMKDEPVLQPKDDSFSPPSSSAGSGASMFTTEAVSKSLLGSFDAAVYELPVCFQDSP